MKARSKLLSSRKPDYGVDAPNVIAAFAGVGAVAIIAGFFVPTFSLFDFEISLIGPTLLAIGALSLLLAGSMLAYSLVGKFRVRDRMLAMIAWRGDEAVLDIGTGRGLLAIGAAKRVPKGMAIGIDIWSEGGLSGNSVENAILNAELEGVASRIDFRSDDPCAISFLDHSFDAIFSLWYLHTIEDRSSRKQACYEIARLLRPGATAVIADYANASEYAAFLKEAGLAVYGPKAFFFQAFTPLWIITAKKPL